jgi:hypothetical protein
MMECKEKFKWPVMQLFSRNLRKTLRRLKHRLNAWLKEDKIRVAKFGHKPMTDEEVHYFEPKQGLFLEEDDSEDVEERPVETLIDCFMSEDQHKDVMIEISNKARDPYIFKSVNLCMVACFANDEDG